MKIRFDDICVNSNMRLAVEMAEHIKDVMPEAEIIFSISPLVHNMSGQGIIDSQRVYPKIFNAKSDHTIFYKPEKLGIPEIPSWIIRASHGLIHVDHRLLSKEVQELSILSSCSLVDTKIFVPPFNKWNKDTEDICKDAEINLIKFEDGWLCAEYNDFNPTHDLWYVHSRELELNKFKEWMT